jgi:hypothetical protein
VCQKDGRGNDGWEREDEVFVHTRRGKKALDFLE